MLKGKIKVLSKKRIKEIHTNNPVEQWRKIIQTANAYLINPTSYANPSYSNSDTKKSETKSTKNINFLSTLTKTKHLRHLQINWGEAYGIGITGKQIPVKRLKESKTQDCH